MRSTTFWTESLVFLAVVWGSLIAGCSSTAPDTATGQTAIAYAPVRLDNRYAIPGSPASAEFFEAAIASGTQPAIRVVESAPADGYLRVLFGTNRSRVEGERRSTRNFFANNRSSLEFGYVDVSIPKSHTIGQIERPSIWRLEFVEDAASHMVLKDVVVVHTARFAQIIRQYQGGGEKPTIAFVHGYNVSFADAAFRTAQIANDLNIISVPTFFSWASRADPALYTIDENTALQSLPDFKEYMRLLAKNSSGKIFLIAHSMGSRLVTQALAEMVVAEPEIVAKVVHIILAAPDLDAAVFKEQIVPVFAKQGILLTLYASSRDKTLLASSKAHGCCRAGLGGKKIVVAKGLESIDATDIDTSFLGHSYFAETRALLGDIRLLVAERLPAASRPFLGQRPDGSSTPTHYYFRK